MYGTLINGTLHPAPRAIRIDGAAGLYDSISGTFHGNAAATGTITAGPRV